MPMDLASTDNPMGFVPYGKVIQANYYSVATNPTPNVCVGDLVEATGTAVATPHMGSLQGAITEETGAAASILGAVLGCYDENFVPIQYIASGRVGNGTIAGYVLVADSPDQVYIAQEDGDTASLVVANIGLNIDAISTHAAAAANGYHSKMELDSNTIANTATLAFKVLGIHPDDTISGTGAAGNHARFLVKLNSPYWGINQTSL